jgi:hypothetical protein
MWEILAAVLRGRGPNRLGFWSLGPWHLSRRIVLFEGSEILATTLSFRFRDSVESSTWLEEISD